VYGELDDILISGSRLARGMPRFDFMSAEDVADVRAYLLARRAELTRSRASRTRARPRGSARGSSTSPSRTSAWWGLRGAPGRKQ
jgi:hypothetical protein